MLQERHEEVGAPNCLASGTRFEDMHPVVGHNTNKKDKEMNPKTERIRNGLGKTEGDKM